MEEKASNNRQDFDIILTDIYVHVVLWCNVTMGEYWFFEVLRRGFVGIAEAVLLLCGIIIGVIMGGLVLPRPLLQYSWKSSAFLCRKRKKEIGVICAPVLCLREDSWWSFIMTCQCIIACNFLVKFYHRRYRCQKCSLLSHVSMLVMFTTWTAATVVAATTAHHNHSLMSSVDVFSFLYYLVGCNRQYIYIYV